METLEEFLNESYVNADWERLKAFTKENYIEKNKIRELLNEETDIHLEGYQKPYLKMRANLWNLL